MVGAEARAGELFAKKAKLPGRWRNNRSGQREVLCWFAVRANFSWRKNRPLKAGFRFAARIVYFSGGWRLWFAARRASLYLIANRGEKRAIKMADFGKKVGNFLGQRCEARQRRKVGGWLGRGG
jgi:hypothetical protein